MTLRFVHENSRFWEVRRDAKEVFARWGQGPDVKTRTVSFKNSTAAERELKRLITQVESLGYKRQRAGQSASPVDRLIAALVADPDDDAPLEVYGDELQAQGDVRGELAGLVAGGRSSQVLKLVRARGPELFGVAWADLTARRVTDVEWAPGFVRKATVHEGAVERGESLERVTRTLLASKAGEFTRALHLDAARGGWAPVLKTLAHSGHPELLVELNLCPCDWSKIDLEDVDAGALGEAWRGLPQLRTLHLVASQGTLGVLDLPELRTLSRRGGGFVAADLKSFKSARLPKLEKLELGFQVPGRCPVDEVLLAAFRLAAPLEHLALRQLVLSRSALEALASSPLLPRLRTLDLSDALVGEAEAEVLLDALDAFEHLEAFAPPWKPDAEGARDEQLQTGLRNQDDYVDAWEA